jgi:hypothetical protein
MKLPIFICTVEYKMSSMLQNVFRYFFFKNFNIFLCDIEQRKESFIRIYNTHHKRPAIYNPLIFKL